MATKIVGPNAAPGASSQIGFRLHTSNGTRTGDLLDDLLEVGLVSPCSAERGVALWVGF